MTISIAFFLLIYKYSLHVKDIIFNTFIEIKLKYIHFAHLNYTFRTSLVVLWLRFHTSTSGGFPDQETKILSINRGMDKEHVVHTYNGLLSHKKNGIMSFAAIVEQRDCHTE